MDNKHIGSNFDDFLREEEILAETEAAALKRVFAWEIQKALKEMHLTKGQVAKKMRTSRAAFDRILDPNNTSVTLKSLERASIALGKRLHIELKDIENFSGHQSEGKFIRNITARNKYEASAYIKGRNPRIGQEVKIKKKTTKSLDDEKHSA